MAKILKDCGLRSDENPVETSAQKLKDAGPGFYIFFAFRWVSDISLFSTLFPLIGVDTIQLMSLKYRLKVYQSGRGFESSATYTGWILAKY